MADAIPAANPPAGDPAGDPAAAAAAAAAPPPPASAAADASSPAGESISDSQTPSDTVGEPSSSQSQNHNQNSKRQNIPLATAPSADTAIQTQSDPAAPSSAPPDAANTTAPPAGASSTPAAAASSSQASAASSSSPAAETSSPSATAPSSTSAPTSQPAPSSTQSSTSAPSTTAPPSTSSKSSSTPTTTSSSTSSSSTSSSSSSSTSSSSSSSSSSAPPTSTKPSTTSKPSTTAKPTTSSSPSKSSSAHSTEIVVITSTASDDSTPTVFSSTITGGPIPTNALPPTNHESHGGGGLSTGGKIAIAVVVPVVGVAILICVALFLLKKRRERKLAEEERKQELEEYGFNPNNDVGGGGAGAASGAAAALAASRGSGPAMDEVSGGYRGWGNTSNHGTKLSTGMTLSDPGSTGSGGATMLEDDLGRPISSGEGFANYAYGPGVTGHAMPSQHPAMGGMNRGMGMPMEDDGMPASLAINRGPGTAVAAATIPGAGTELPQGNAAEQGYMGNHNAQGSGESGMYGYGAPGAAAVMRNNTTSSTSSGNLTRDNSGAARPDRSPRRGPSNASSAYSGSAARNSDVSDDGGAFADQARFSNYGAPGMGNNNGFTQYNTEMPANLHHQQPNPYGQAVELHIPGSGVPDAGAGAYQGGFPARAQSGGYDEYDYNDAYRGSQIYGPRNTGNNGGSYVNF